MIVGVVMWSWVRTSNKEGDAANLEAKECKRGACKLLGAKVGYLDIFVVAVVGVVIVVTIIGVVIVVTIIEVVVVVVVGGRDMIHNELSNSVKIDSSKGKSGGGVVDLTGDADPIDKDGDTKVGDLKFLVSLGEISSGGRKSQE
uniref:Uncharacterized protein n=1 Tax=Tanacetum cinerariifolium TaxID=118510 RepID=A0A6L2MLV2_TANCI|nr:hypothetical protein [Tanacetum cinerariifolium]